MEDIQKQLASLSNDQLVAIVNNRMRYTEKIERLAYQEMKRRGLSKAEFKETAKKLAHQPKIITGDIHEDVLLFEKIGFFFLFFPRIHFFVLRDYRKRGYLLKLKQAGYYNAVGAALFFLDVFLGLNHISLLTGTIIWGLSFLPAYAFNEYYFKQRTIKRLAARTARREPNTPA